MRRAPPRTRPRRQSGTACGSQLHRVLDKTRDQQRQRVAPEALPRDPLYRPQTGLKPAPLRRIVHRQTYIQTPLGTVDAVDDLLDIDAEFMLFVHARTHEDVVVYLRDDGRIGLLFPEGSRLDGRGRHRRAEAEPVSGADLPACSTHRDGLPRSPVPVLHRGGARTRDGHLPPSRRRLRPRGAEMISGVLALAPERGAIETLAEVLASPDHAADMIVIQGSFRRRARQARALPRALRGARAGAEDRALGAGPRGCAVRTRRAGRLPRHRRSARHALPRGTVADAERSGPRVSRRRRPRSSASCPARSIPGLPHASNAPRRTSYAITEADNGSSYKEPPRHRAGSR